jgi:hypothetical protein
VGSRERVVRATIVRRAGLASTVAVLSLVAAACTAAPTMPSQDRAAARACGSGTDAVTVRTVAVYVAVLQQFRHPRRGVVLYVVDRAGPMWSLKDASVPSERTDNNGAAAPSQRRPTAPRSTSTAPFTASVKGCLASVRLPDLPPIRLVSGVDDPRVAKKQGMVADGAVVQLEGVPPTGDRLALAVSSYWAPLGASGRLYILELRAGTWQVVDIRAQWIA